MEVFPFKGLSDFLDATDTPQKDASYLYRGQSLKAPLLPKVARKDPLIDTTAKEKKMLSELRRRSMFLSSFHIENDWDLLVCAQHHGMDTRLLDWSSNPLAALWFACCSGDTTSSAYVYILIADEEMLLDVSKEKDPFDISNTRVFKPKLNNARVLAQSGWFTAHRYSTKSNRFVSLEQNKDLSENVICVEIPGNEKANILLMINRLGVNYQSMFPDMEGVCRHINWLHN